MFNYKSVYWHSGLYLQPQHLQAQEIQHDYWQGRYQQLTHPYAFGIVKLIFNQSALEDEVVSVHQASFVFPDGSYIDCAVNGVLSDRSLRDSWLNREKPLRIYVGLRSLSHTQNNVTGIADPDSVGDATSRWVTWPDEQRMRDAYGDGPESEVQQLSYNLRFFWQHELEQATGYTFLPIGQLRVGVEHIELDTSYIPPGLSLYAMQHMGQYFENLYQELVGRTHHLEELKRPQALEDDAYTQNRNTLLFVLRSLASNVSQFHHYLAARDIHPWSVFMMLTQLIAELSCFTDRCSFLGQWRDRLEEMPNYQHLELARTFAICEKNIVSLLNALVLEPNSVISLQPSSQGSYSAVFNFSKIQHEQRLYLSLRSNSFTYNEYVIPDDRLIKLAAAEQLSQIVNRALPGIRLYYQEIAPHGLPNRQNTRYFRIENHGSLWRQVEEKESIALHWADAPDDLQAEIIIVRAS